MKPRQGTRVQLHPATDLWMRGARFGEVIAVGRTTAKIMLDSGKIVRVKFDNILEEV